MSIIDSLLQHYADSNPVQQKTTIRSNRFRLKNTGASRVAFKIDDPYAPREGCDLRLSHLNKFCYECDALEFLKTLEAEIIWLLQN